MQRVERLSVEDVSLEVQHCGPDPHGREHLDYREPPVGEQQLDSFEQHDKGTERCEDTPATAQLKDRGLDRGFVARVDGADQSPDLGHQGCTARDRASRRAVLLGRGRTGRAWAVLLDVHPGRPHLLDRRIR